MDELDALDCEVDRKKEALASKQAVISLMDCEARIDDWSDRELISRLTLVSSLEEGGMVVEDRSEDGGLDPSPMRYGLQHPKKDCRGQVGDS